MQSDFSLLHEKPEYGSLLKILVILKISVNTCSFLKRSVTKPFLVSIYPFLVPVCFPIVLLTSEATWCAQHIFLYTAVTDWIPLSLALLFQISLVASHSLLVWN